MFIVNVLKRLSPKRFLWRLTLLNILVIAPAIAVSGWAIYHTACFLVEGMGTFDEVGQRYFNRTLFKYLWLFSIVSFLVSSFLQFYFTKKLVRPIRQLTSATKQMKKGQFPKKIDVQTEDEVGELVHHYNELMQQLKANERERNRYIANLSHEIRTPLANVNGYLHALKNGVIVADESLFASLYAESNRLTNMVKQLDEMKEWDYLAAQKIVQKERIAMKQLIRQSVAMFEWRLAEKGIPLILNVEEETLVIHVAGIQQVLSNLLDNAIDYYDGTDSIVITGESFESHYRVTVTGPGKHIEADEKARLFDRFYRKDGMENHGSGLGLAIVKDIVENVGGEVGVSVQDGKNSFSFTILKEERTI